MLVLRKVLLPANIGETIYRVHCGALDVGYVSQSSIEGGWAWRFEMKPTPETPVHGIHGREGSCAEAMQAFRAYFDHWLHALALRENEAGWRVHYFDDNGRRAVSKTQATEADAVGLAGDLFKRGLKLLYAEDDQGLRLWPAELLLRVCSVRAPALQSHAI